MEELLEKILAMKEQGQTEEQAATQIMIHMGIRANLKGYRYLRTAILLTVEQPELIQHMTTKLYIQVGEYYHVKSGSVERAIRYAIDIAYSKNQKHIQQFFQSPISKPYNSEMIAFSADIIRTIFK